MKHNRIQLLYTYWPSNAVENEQRSVLVAEQVVVILDKQ